MEEYTLLSLVRFLAPLTLLSSIILLVGGAIVALCDFSDYSSGKQTAIHKWGKACIIFSIFNMILSIGVIFSS